jgi:glutamate-1-semialdehyde 2,1-aminomutase
MTKSTQLYKEAKRIIPGGTQLLSKRPEMHLPEFWPSYFKKSKGCEIWDLDDKKYIDASFMGVGTNILGYADEDIDNKVIQIIKDGNSTTLNPPEEVELANLLISLHPWAQMARFARSGGEAVAIAVRIARAYTRKEIVLFCGYHGWHDWYLAANLADNEALNGHLIPGLSPLGVPRSLKGTSYPFKYNDTNSLKELFEIHKNKIGAIVMEPIREMIPDQAFLDTISNLGKTYDIPLIVDEVSAGWRINLGGAHLKLGIEPDIAVFAKGMSNGYPMAAIIGKEKVMQAAQDSFISSTYWTERIGPTAAIACIKKMKEQNVQDHLITIGKEVKNIWKQEADNNGIEIHIGGLDPVGHFVFKYEKQLIHKTLFTQLMLERGFLATTAFYTSFAHKLEHLVVYRKAVSETFKIIAQSIIDNNTESLLKGPVCHAGFSRLA